MDFLAGFVLGSNSDYKLGLPFTFQLLIGVAIYKALEKYLIANFTDNLLEMFIGVILLTILIIRYTYSIDCCNVSRWGIYFILFIIDYPLCIALSIVFFNYIGFTPFSLLIDSWNLLGWDTYSLVECIGEILWAILKLLHYVCTIGCVLLIQKFMLLFVRP